MPSIYTSWLVGAINFGSAQDYTISGTGYDVAAGDYYLRDATAGRSLLAQIQADMTAEGLANASVFVDQSGYVHLKSDDSFTVTWTDTALRDALGFTSNITSTTNATAQKHSPLWWSPGWPETPATPVGVDAYPVPDTQITSSPTGLTTKHTTHHTAYWQEWNWASVPVSRVWTAAENGGEFRRFWSEVLQPGYRFKLYSDIQENVGSSTAVIWTSAQGPYKTRDIDPTWYNRGAIALSDVISDIEVKAVKVDDI